MSSAEYLLFTVIDGKYDAAQRPGKRIDPVGDGDIMDEQAGYGQHQDTHDAPGHEHDDHG